MMCSDGAKEYMTYSPPDADAERRRRLERAERADRQPAIARRLEDLRPARERLRRGRLRHRADPRRRALAEREQVLEGDEAAALRRQPRQRVQHRRRRPVKQRAGKRFFDTRAQARRRERVDPSRRRQRVVLHPAPRVVLEHGGVVAEGHPLPRHAAATRASRPRRCACSVRNASGIRDAVNTRAAASRSSVPRPTRQLRAPATAQAAQPRPGRPLHAASTAGKSVVRWRPARPPGGASPAENGRSGGALGAGGRGVAVGFASGAGTAVAAGETTGGTGRHIPLPHGDERPEGEGENRVQRPYRREPHEDRIG